MTFVEIVILILVVGFVSMIEIAMIMACVGKLFDTKTKARIELSTKLFENEMKYLDNLFDKYMTRIENLIASKDNKD